MSLSLKYLSVSARVTVLAIVPLAVVLIGGGLYLSEVRHRAIEAQAVAEVVSVAPVISDLVHELQKERGTSAGFIGSKGVKFADTIGPRRSDTDQALAAFRAAIPAATGRLDFPGFREPFEAAKAELDALTTVRSEIDALTRSVPEMAGYYSPLIAKLLASVESVALITNDGLIVRDLTAYVAFLQAKERAGIERAMGASGFGANKFAEPVYRNFVGLGAMQTAFMSLFERFASDEEIAAWRGLLDSDEQKTVDRMRQVAFKNPFGGDMRTVSGPAWFEASTKRIDLMKEIEGRLARHIVADAGRVAADAMRFFWMGVSALAALLLGIMALSYLIARSVSRPLLAMANTMTRLAQGATDLHIEGLERTDELGGMARAVSVFRENALGRKQLESRSREERVKELERQTQLDTVISDFRSLIDETMRSFDTQTGAMRHTAATLSDAAHAASSEAGSAERASSGASGNVQTVAEATEEMVAAVREISGQAVQANTMVSKATDIALDTNREVESLADAASRIGTVVGMIRDIAEQTNLLALNATIEAARAGELGRGFAVVASEVKELAGQTSKATEEISAQIAAVQAQTQNAVDAIARITETVGDISAVTTTIASAVEEQEASTQEIAESIRLASGDTQSAMGNAKNVSITIQKTADEAGSVEAASDALSSVAQRLAGEVERFLKDVSRDVEMRRATLQAQLDQMTIIHEDGRRGLCTVVEMEQSGCKLRTEDRLDVGDIVILEQGDGRQIEARVARLEGGVAVFQFGTAPRQLAS